MKNFFLSLALMKYCPQTNPATGKMNQMNNGKAPNPPAEPIKSAKNKFEIGNPKSKPLVNVPIKDITTAITIIHLFESLNLFNTPIKTNAKPANAKMSTQNNNNPSSVGKTHHLPKRAPQIQIHLPKGIGDIILHLFAS